MPQLIQPVRLSLLLICIALPSLLTAQTAPSQAASAQAQGIAAAIRQHDFSQAIELSQVALQQFPGDPKLWSFEGIAFSGLGKTKDALAAYDHALRIAPDYIPALEGAAELEYTAGSNRASGLLERILKLQPENTTAHAMLGVLEYKRHDCSAAVKHFQAAKDALSSQPAALAELGTCLMDLNQPEQALPVFTQLVALQPEDPHARYNLAVVQISSHHPKDVIATLQPLLQSAPPEADVLDLASAAYEETGDTPNAVKLLRQAIVQDPKKVRYYVDFATLSFAHGSFDVGIDMLNVGIQQNPNSSALYVARGVLYIQLGKYEQGEADFEEANKLDPQQSSGAVAEGLAQIQQSNPAQALATIRAHLKDHPSDAFLHYLEAQALFQQGPDPGTPEFKQSIAAAERAIQLRPDLVLARDLLGNLYLQSGGIERSIAQSRRALQLSPSDQESLYHLIQALRKSKPGSPELPALVKRLAELRQQSRSEEAAGNRYRLYEAPSQNQTAP